MRAAIGLLFLTACGVSPLPDPEPREDLSALIAADPDYARANWMGDRLDGAACSFAHECQSGRCSTVGAACGVCQERRLLGQTCGGPNQVCSHSAECRLGVCTSTKRTVGALCDPGPKGGNGDDCDDELVCIRLDPKAPTTCQRPRPVGASCLTWNSCRQMATCSADAVCVAVVSPGGGAGQRCAAGAPCPSGYACDDQATCLPASTVWALGESCGRDAQGYTRMGRCGEGLTCGNLAHRNGGGAWDTPLSCLALPIGGETAINFRCAAGFFADPLDPALRCQPGLGVGALCRSEEWCATGLECRGTCEKRCD